MPWRFPAVPRVIAFGDVHGDLGAVRRAMKLAKVLDDADHWSGGTTWVVQTGDVLDRGDDEQAIIDLFERLEGEARAAGGRFVWLLGNHELMNPAGDMRYTTRGGFHDFEDVPGLPLDRFANVPEAARARVAALAPGGPYAKILSGQTVVAVVGDTAFVHGGLVPGVAAELDADQRATRCWLAGQGPPPDILDRQDGPVWDRSEAGDDVDCARLDTALAELGVNRLVVGHTVQAAGITSACDDRVWRIDVGLSRYYGGPTQVLEITSAGAHVLR
ncbi:MAG TPA: metallophosphoesterase [Kofleriaceae bacterium]|nr:metallophosphoesterase [Kofleriaceae bacterium]